MYANYPYFLYTGNNNHQTIKKKKHFFGNTYEIFASIRLRGREV